MHGVVELETNIIDNMQAHLLKGSNAQYFYFPKEPDTVISRSKFSIVYIGAEVETKQKVICKRLAPELFNNQSAKLKFFIESSINLQHEGIAKTIDLIVEDDNVFLIQEYIYGHTLQDLIADKKYYDKRYDKFFYRIIIKTLEALDFIHKQGLTHCDIKPSNIMIIDKKYNLDINNPKIKIIDLGNVKPAFKETTFDLKSKTYNLMYGSPEQIFGYSELVGDHSDLFSLACVLYEAIAKEPALSTANPMFLRRLQSVVKINQHYRINDDLYRIISKATEKPELIKSAKKYSDNEIKMKIVEALDKRYQNAMSFRNDLIELMKPKLDY